MKQPQERKSVKSFPREEVEAAVHRYVKEVSTAHLDGARGWTAFFGRHFTEDALYIEHEFGTRQGRQAIIDWASDVLGQSPVISEVEFELDWYMIEGNRVVVRHRDGFRDPRGGGRFEVVVVTILEYGGNGQWSFEEDIYNAKEFERAFASYSASKANAGSATHA